MRGVGGRTAVWKRAALRVSDRQFKAASLDAFGVDWPIDYARLAPHYDEVEQSLGVGGIAEDLCEVPDGSFAPGPLSERAREFRAAVQDKWSGRRVTSLRVTRTARTLEQAAAPGRLAMRTNAIVSRVLTSENGTRACGVAYVDVGSMRTHEQHARVVVVRA
jgi:hypothetical protein